MGGGMTLMEMEMMGRRREGRGPPMMNFGAPMGNMGPMRPMMDGPMGPMGPMGMGGPMGPRGPMGPGGPMGRPMLDESMLGERGEPPIRVMGELYHEEVNYFIRIVIFQ